MVSNYPNFDYNISLQGTGNPVTFTLGSIADSLRTSTYQYDTTSATVKYWSLTVKDWFVGNSSLNGFSTYYLCLEIPASHDHLGVIQTSGSVFANKIVLSASNINKTYTNNNNGAPCIEVYDDSAEFFFKAASGAGGATWASDNVILRIIDQAGNDLATSGTTRKITLKYKEFIQF